MFRYATKLHSRRHGPAGHADYPAFKPWLRDDYEYRRVYCLVRETWNPSGADAFGADHAKPKRYRPDLRREYDNLFYACNRCNSFKGEEKVMNPDRHALADHLEIEDDGTVSALTPAGRRQCMLLELNADEMVRYRKKLIETIRFIREGLPKTKSLLTKWLGYPDDLPDLRRKRPPDGNTRPAGIASCAFERRFRGELPETY